MDVTPTTAAAISPERVVVLTVDPVATDPISFMQMKCLLPPTAYFEWVFRVKGCEHYRASCLFWDY